MTDASQEGIEDIVGDGPTRINANLSDDRLGISLGDIELASNISGQERDGSGSENGGRGPVIRI